MTVRIEYNDTYEEWDIDSGAPTFIHTAAETRKQAIKKARDLKSQGEQIKIKGPRMRTFKNL